LEVTRVGQALERRVLELREQHARNRAIVEEYRAYILPETERAYRKYLERFKDEESSFSRVKSSQGSYRDRSLEYLDALLNLRRAEVDLSTLDLSGTEDTKN
jgi:phage-related minor tail protein